MEGGGALAIMAPKKDKRKVGRPKAATKLRSLVSLKGSPELESWLDGLTEATDSGTRSNTIRRALKVFAAQQAFETPIPKR